MVICNTHIFSEFSSYIMIDSEQIDRHRSVCVYERERKRRSE